MVRNSSKGPPLRLPARPGNAANRRIFPLYRGPGKIARINGPRRGRIFLASALEPPYNPPRSRRGGGLPLPAPLRAKPMKKEVVIPRLGSSDESDEVKILRWLKRAGEKVRQGEPLLEVETDKVHVEIEATASGLLSEIRAEAGQAARFNSVVAIIESED